MAGFGAVLQVVAASADLFHHSLIRVVGSWLSLALLLLYSAFAITLVGTWRGFRANSRQGDSIPIQFVNVAGFKLVGLGCLIELIAVVWNETVRYFIGTALGFASAYALLTVGLLTVNLGVAVGVTIEYGMTQHQLIFPSRLRREMMSLLILLTFSAIWLAVAGALIFLGWIYQFSPWNWAIAFFLGFTATFVLTPLKKVMPRTGSGVVTGLAFNATVYSIVVVYAGSRPYIPWGLLPILLFELALYLLGPIMAFKRAALLSALPTGMLFDAMYYPFTAYVFPWSFSQQPLILVPVIGSVVGVLIGVRVYAGLFSVVLGEVRPSR